MKREPTAAEVEALLALYRASRFFDAYEGLKEFSEPEQWREIPARIIAGRLFSNLGAGQRARQLLLQTWRAAPADLEAFYYVVLDYQERHGPLEALRFMDDQAKSDPRINTPSSDAGKTLASLWGLRARCLSLCRDFEAAEIWIAAGLRAQPQYPWLHVEHAICLEFADRYSEALDAAERAIALQPNYARATWQVAHLLVALGREPEAIARLQYESAQNQSPHLPLELSTLLAEQGRLEEALVACEVALHRFPMAEKTLLDALSSKRAGLLHRLGRDTTALEIARDLQGRYWENFRTRLSSGRAPQREVLPVPFVRQKHVTCAPATLSAVSTFLGAPIDQDALARIITYDGTPDHEERHWLESHGWVVREFRVTWEIAVALIARGLPFTLVTAWTQAAHLQAVIGYDEQLGHLIIRDPYQRESYDTLAAELLEGQAPFGPRGSVFVRADDAARLDGLAFPDAAQYDAWFQVRRALVGFDRETASQAIRRLEAESPTGRLTWWARRHLAYYDDNPGRALEAVQALRVMYPEEANLQLEELNLLTRLGRRTEHRATLARFMRNRKADPAIWREQIELWRVDAREHRRAQRLARRYARVRWSEAVARSTLADVLWDQREFTTATQVYRLAATNAETSEPLWRSYFAAARHIGEETAALDLLRKRTERLGSRSTQPAITLAHSFEQLGQPARGRECLEEALRHRPDDGNVTVELGLLAGRYGDLATATDHISRARARLAPADWHRAAARVARWQPDNTAALQHYEALLAENPLDLAAMTEAARCRAALHGPAVALEWLAECTGRYPHFLPLRQLRLEWLRDFPADRALADVRTFLEIEPHDAWALREQALILVRLVRLPEALASATLAETIEPAAAASAGIGGRSCSPSMTTRRPGRPPNALCGSIFRRHG